MLVLFLKAHVKGYTRKDGVYVKDHETKAPAAKPSLKTPTKPVKAQWPDAFSKKPLSPDSPAGKFPGESSAASSWPFKDGSGPKSSKWTNSLHSGGTGQSKGQGSLFGGGFSKPSYPNAIVHPKADDNGKPFKINEPSTPSAPETWADPSAIALFTPGGETPADLHGVPFAPWTDHPRTDEGWDYVEGQMDDLDEPAMNTKGKAPAAGVVIEEPDGRIWIVRPSNGFAGYTATFPKGHADEGMSLQATAIKECFEESGLKVQITGFIGDVERGQTMARYYRAKRVGGTPSACGWETQGVALVPKSELHAYVNRDVDRQVATLAGVEKPAKAPIESADDWEKVGMQAGSNPGGVFVDPAGQEWYVKLPKSSNIAKNEVLAGKLYEAAGIRVPELKHVTVGGKLGIASKIVPDLRKDRTALESGKVKGANDGFAVDAWLANWDVVGLLHDNLMLDKNDEAVRVDVGGSLVFRAQGDPKGAAFGDTVGELKSLIDGKNVNSTAVFGKITPAEVKASAQRVAAIPDETIRSLCLEYGPGDKTQRQELADRLIKRKAHLLSVVK